MRELPILFKAEMHLAIREGRKTETRRIIKGPICFGVDGAVFSLANGLKLLKPRYQVGDRLWVKESYRPYRDENGDDVIAPSATNPAVYRLDYPSNRGEWKSAMFMPKWAARTWLEVTGVRAERLQEITEEGAKAEGVQSWPFDPQQHMTTGELGIEQPYRGGFACLWDDINEEHTWKSNPWVWVYQFKLLEARTR